MSTHVPVVRPGWPTGPRVPRVSPGHPMPGFSYPVSPRSAQTRRLGHGRHFSMMITGLGAAVLVVAIVAASVVKPTPSTCTTPLCLATPPTGSAIQSWPLYTNPEYKFTVRLIDADSEFTSSTSGSAGQLNIAYKYDGTSVGNIGIGAFTDKNGETAEQIVSNEVSQNANGASVAYVIPGAMIGYQPGYGAAYNFVGDSADGQDITYRLIVMAAVRDGLAIVTFASGPFVSFGDGSDQIDLTDHHASIADSLVAVAADPVVNSIEWPGENTP